MRTQPVQPEDWRGVFPVPPLARKDDAGLSIDFDESEKIVKHIADGGILNFLYGGNAFLYHMRLREYAELVEWMSGFPPNHWMIPSAGPSYGRAMDQAEILAALGRFTHAFGGGEEAAMQIAAFSAEHGETRNAVAQGITRYAHLLPSNTLYDAASKMAGEFVFTGKFGVMDADVKEEAADLLLPVEASR